MSVEQAARPRRSVQPARPRSRGVWKIAYADLITALMATFLALWLIEGRLGALAGRAPVERGGEGDAIGSGDALFGLGFVPLPVEEKDGPPPRNPFARDDDAALDQVLTLDPPSEDADDRANADATGRPPERVVIEAIVIKEVAGAEDGADAILYERARSQRDGDPNDGGPPNPGDDQPVEQAARDDAPIEQRGRDAADDISPTRAAAVDLLVGLREVRATRAAVQGLADDVFGEQRGEEAGGATDGADENAAMTAARPPAPPRTDQTPRLSVDASSPAQAAGETVPRQPTPPALVARRAAETEARARRRHHALMASLAAEGELDPAFGAWLEHVSIERAPGGVRFAIRDQDDRSMFAPGGSRFSVAGVEALQGLARALGLARGAIAIEGHTDAVPFAGGGRDNWDLSSERAHAARRALIEAGIDPARIARVSGRGASEPLLADQPEAAANRRITIVVLDPEGEPARADAQASETAPATTP